MAFAPRAWILALGAIPSTCASAPPEKLAEPALRKKLTQEPTLELQRRVEELLDRLEKPVMTGEALQAWRALEVLESIGTPEARQVLEIMSRGAEGSRLTKEARAALDRFDRQATANR